MRKYQPIWNAIKKDNTASLVADTKLHARIINAVRKEKARDLGWKLILSEQGKKYKMEETIEGKMITFYLVDISPIHITDL